MSTAFPYRHVKRQHDTWLKPTQISTTGKFWGSARTWWSTSATALAVTPIYGGTNWKHMKFMIKDTGGTSLRETLPLNIPGRQLVGTALAEKVGLDLTEHPQELQKLSTTSASVNNLFVDYDQYRIDAINHMALFRNYGTSPFRVMWRVIKYDAAATATTLNDPANPITEGDSAAVEGGKEFFRATDWNTLDIPGVDQHGSVGFVERSVPLAASVAAIFPDKEFNGSGRDASFDPFVTTGPRFTSNAIGLQLNILNDVPYSQDIQNITLHFGLSANWLYKVRTSNVSA